MKEPLLIHGTCVLLGERALLIRGAAGTGKSTLARQWIDQAGPSLFARLIADDQTLLMRCGNALIAAAPRQLAGLMEIAQFGIVRAAYEHEAVLAAVLDLEADAPRMAAFDDHVVLSGIKLPRHAALPRSPVSLARALRLLDGQKQYRES